MLRMIEQYREKDQRAGHDFNDTMAMALLKQDGKLEKFKKYRERTLGIQHPSQLSNRVSKKQS